MTITRDYAPYDPTPVEVTPKRDETEEDMCAPERPLLNMSNFEQRKMFSHLAKVPIKEIPDVVSKEYNFTSSSKTIIWQIHHWAKFYKLNISDIVRVNRIVSLPASESSPVLFSTTDRKGKIRVYDNRRYGCKQLTRRELAESIQFSSNRSLDLAKALQIIEKYKVNPAIDVVKVIDHE